jgi:hypothetical protein
VESDAIWKIRSISPWSAAQTAPLDVFLPAPAAAVLPELAVSPVRPGLAPGWDIRFLDARPVEVVSDMANGVASALRATLRPTVPPAISDLEPAFSLPAAPEPRPLDWSTLRPQNVAAFPAHAGEAPMAACAPASLRLDATLESCLKTCAAGAPKPELGEGGPISGETPTFISQTALARYSSGMLNGRGAVVSTGMPAATRTGFPWVPFATLAPAAARMTPAHVVPQPETIREPKLALRRPDLPVDSVESPARSGVMAIDVYVQRVRSLPKRECEWTRFSTRLEHPCALPDLFPARFEQQVLQDWKRRYPARLAAVAPAPVLDKGKVVPIGQRLKPFAGLHLGSQHALRAAAAALFLGAVLWFGMASKGVRSTIKVDGRWVKDAIARRAPLVIDDNFRSGLNLWDGRRNWAKSWSYSADGFMRTGQLALYRPTLKLDNYRLEFFAQIESKSLGWVFRAKDEQNYYAMKLSVTEPGPRPLVSVVRYPVLNGKKGKRVQIPLPIMMHNNTPYHVALDVKGTSFRAFIEDQEVDSWNDDRLRAGGVGFFSETGEHARLYWVKVSKNTDWLGRLCGMIAGGTKQDEASLWNADEANGQMAILDPRGVLDGARNADRRRGMPVLPFAAAFLSNSF